MLTSVLWEQWLAKIARVNALRGSFPEEWRKVTGGSQSVFWLTPDEAAAFEEELTAMLFRYRERLEDPPCVRPGASPSSWSSSPSPSTPPARKATDAMKALLGQRDIRLLVLARFVDMLGDNVMWIALGIWIKELTGSDSAAGMSFFVFVLGSLFAPFGGVVVDRVRRGPLIVVLNLVAVLVVLPLLLVHGRGEVWLIYAVMLGYGMVSGVTGSAMTAYTQALIPAEQLGEANGLIQTALQGLRLVAPLIGAAVLSAYGIAPLVLGDAATFVLAALLIRAIRGRESAPRRGTGASGASCCAESGTSWAR
ncbi:MFS transporter [Streptacidiphilus monticola]